MASKQALLTGPAPMQVQTAASLRARCRVATPGTQPVRTELIRLADMRAMGSQVSGSLSITMRMDRGKPRWGLMMLEPYHLTPHTLNRPPRYAGMAMKRRSGPSRGMLGNSLSLGNLIMMP